ncbi:MAG: hypothetical protein PHT99_01280 [Methanoregula sp.]|nr:hypothetical protein [Methanoregula sp.]
MKLPQHRKNTRRSPLRFLPANAVRASDDAPSEQALETIPPVSIAYAAAMRMPEKSSPENEPVTALLDQGNEVMSRSGLMNAELSSLGITCTQTRVLVGTGHSQISLAQMQIDAGNAREARATITAFRGTLQYLRDAYRAILVREDLPRPTAQGVLAVAQSLDRMTVRLSTDQRAGISRQA